MHQAVTDTVAFGANNFSNVTVALMGVPDVAVNVVPGSRALPNVLGTLVVMGRQPQKTR